MVAGLVLMTSLRGAQIYGRVTLQGTPPPEVRIRFDAQCAQFHHNPVYTQHYVVGLHGGLADVFVYIKEVPGGKHYLPPKTEAVLAQSNCLYVPHVMGVMTNQKLTIVNDDPVLHNVRDTTDVPGNKEFNFAQPIKGMVHVVSFPKREVMVKFTCGVHPWMFAYVGVMNHPFFAVTDKEGRFRLPPGLPAGTYTLIAYHVKAGQVSHQIAVTAHEKKEVDFTLKVP